jgi:hypothetical protein
MWCRAATGELVGDSEHLYSRMDDNAAVSVLEMWWLQLRQTVSTALFHDIVVHFTR